MKALRNFEALFVAIIGLACAANYALDTAAIGDGAPTTYAAALPAATPGMHIVTVTAKRMSEAEKQASLAAERKQAPQENI